MCHAYHKFAVMQCSHQLCAASKKLFSDLQKFISELDKKTNENLRKKAPVKDIYNLGTTEAHEIPIQLPEGGEIQSISSETVYNKLVEQKLFIDLEKILKSARRSTQLHSPKATRREILPLITPSENKN